MRLSIRCILLVCIIALFAVCIPFSLQAGTEKDLNMVWTAAGPEASSPQLVWITDHNGALPDSIDQIKNVKAGVDMDGDGQKEFMVPVRHLEDGVTRRSIFVYENTGDDAYEAVWSYTFPGAADQFVTLEVSDLDGDGNQEILAVHIPAGTDNASVLFVFENQGDNDYGTEPTVEWDLDTDNLDIVRVAKAADLDGDGQQEVVMTAFTTQPGIVIASVSDFSLPVWTKEFVNDTTGGASVDIAAIGLSDMDGDGTTEVVLTDGATNSLIIIEATGADTYMSYSAAFPKENKSVSVHGIDTADANGDGQDEVFIANLQGAVWVVTSADVSTFSTADIHEIDDTEEQWLEAGTGNLSGRGTDFVIAASNASKAVDYQYTGGPGGDVTDATNYLATTIIDIDDFAGVVPGGIRVYGLDVADDMDGDGQQEVVFTRGSTRGGHDAQAIFVVEIGELTPPTSVDGDIVGVPDEFALFQNYPNPFNPETKIVYHVAAAGHVSIGIYNIVGQKVRTLVSAEQQANSYTVQWDGKNDSGLQVPTGMYFYRLRAPGFTQTKRMLLLR